MSFESPGPLGLGFDDQTLQKFKLCPKHNLASRPLESTDDGEPRQDIEGNMLLATLLLGARRLFRSGLLTALICGAAVTVSCDIASAQGLVPGTGTKQTKVGDDFEDEKWQYVFNNPKASSNIDQEMRQPSGGATNARWWESMYRGHPDIVQRVTPPPGGIPGSKGAMLLQTKESGIPGSLTHKDQQDDLLASVSNIIGSVAPGRGPSVVVRVYVPPFHEWEARTGSSFGVRLDCQTTFTKQQPGGFLRSAKSVRKTEPYWPGMFVQLVSKRGGQAQEDSAHILIRSDEQGRDLMGPKLKPATWYTLGMSVTPNGMVHYYVREGVDKLTAKDHVSSQYPYGYQAELVHTFFFNVVNQDDGRSWSTKWIVDDCEFFTAY